MKIPKYIQDILKQKENEVLRLDLGCSDHKMDGSVGIDIKKLPGVDIVHDLEKFPWPLPSECATVIVAGHIVEHINPHKGVFLNFMNEAWRVLKYDGQFFISTPYAGSRGYWGDPTHCNPCSKDTWYYFDPIPERQIYNVYKPLPWKIEKMTFQVNGNMEILLSKRRIDKSYHCLYTPDGKEKE